MRRGLESRRLASRLAAAGALYGLVNGFASLIASHGLLAETNGRTRLLVVATVTCWGALALVFAARSWYPRLACVAAVVIAAAQVELVGWMFRGHPSGVYIRHFWSPDAVDVWLPELPIVLSAVGVLALLLRRATSSPTAC